MTDQLVISAQQWISWAGPSAGPPFAFLTVWTWLESAFSAAPALAIGISALAVIPVLLIVGGLIRRHSDQAPSREKGTPHDDDAPAGNTVRVAKNTEIRAVYRDNANTPEEPGIATQALRSPPRPMNGVITVIADGASGPNEQASSRQLEFGRTTLMRIGREPDNELVLSEPTVHRYHAAIERTMDAGYVITDLSGDKGNGVLVNTRRIAKAQLGDGDEIKLGAAVLSFSLRKQ